jgi:hypothetical protein
MIDKYYTILKFNNGKVRIEPTYGGHIWDSPIYSVIDYTDTYKDAQAIARKIRENQGK